MVDQVNKEIISQRAIEYNRLHTRRIVLNMHLEKDRDILQHFEEVPNLSRYIKNLIREDMKKA